MLNGKLGIKDLYIGSVWKINGGTSITVMEIINARSIKIKHNDGFGHIDTVAVRQIVTGNIKNPYTPSVYGFGYLGVGPYVSRVNNNLTLEYSVWANMLKRCYHPGYHLTHPTYIDCVVCDEWLNFQTFAHWYVNNGYYGLGYEIDKDLLVRGNKRYSADTCVMLPSAINGILSTKPTDTRTLPTGIYPCRTKYQVKVCGGSNSTYVGVYPTLRLAVEAQRRAKKIIMNNLAEKYANSIDPRAYQALVNWTFD